MAPTSTAPPSASSPKGQIGIGSASDLDELRYSMSFPNIGNKSVYLDMMRGIDIRNDEGFMSEMKSRYGMDLEAKGPLVTTSNLMATGTTYSATSGSIPTLLPTWVDQKLYDVTKRDTPLASGLIPRVTNIGLFADYIVRTAVPTAVWQAEAASLASTSGTYTRYAQAMKFAYAVGEVSGPMIVASKVWQNALTYEIEAQYKALKYLEENTIINGDTTSATYTYGFNGLIALTDTNYTNAAGTAEITLAQIDGALATIRQTYYGDPDLAVTDWRTFYRIKQLMRDFIRYNEVGATMNFGFENIVYEGRIPIIPDVFMPSTPTAREFLLLTVHKENNIQIRVLQEATMEELAKTADSYKFVIKEYCTMICVKEAWNHRWYNLP